jgi:hypothetical protein
MANANGAVVQFQPIDTGDMNEIPPDLPPGEWTAKCSVKRAATTKDKYPMLVLEWKTTEDLTGDNEDQVGQRASDLITFFPSNHKATRIFRQRLKAMCDVLGVDVPNGGSLAKGSWDDLEDFISALEGLSATIYTTVEARKDTGELVTKVRYTKPGGSLALQAAAVTEEEEDETPKKPAPRLGPNGRPLKKKTAK